MSTTKRKQPLPRFLGSSVDQTELAMTWRGVILGLFPVIVIVAKQFDVELDQNILVAILDSGLAIAASVMVFVGVVRKFVVKHKEKKQS